MFSRINGTSKNGICLFDSTSYVISSVIYVPFPKTQKDLIAGGHGFFQCNHNNSCKNRAKGEPIAKLSFCWYVLPSNLKGIFLV